MLMPMDFYKEVGGFDLSFGLGWFEDVWLCQEAIKRGYTLVEVKVGITHLGSQTIMDGSFETNKLMAKAGYYFRDRVIKELIPEGKLRIVFLCQGNCTFSDGSWEGKGVGGAEASLILLTRELAKQGHLVEVYNDPEVPGEQNGVFYHKIEEFRFSDYSDVLICFRNPVGFIEQANAMVKIFWSCDQYTVGDYNISVFPVYDKVICISEFHKKFFERSYTGIKKDQIVVIPLGVSLQDYQDVNKVPKIPYKLLFCSVPHRGLLGVLERFENIKSRFPKSELFITSDYRLWGVDDPRNEVFVEKARNMKGVHFLGKVSRKELVRHQLESEIMAYPCVYEENFCISAAECIAAGAIPVTMSIGAMPETVADCGIVVPKNDILRWEAELLRLMGDEERKKALRKMGSEMALSRFDWKNIASEWEKLLFSWKEKSMLDLQSRLPKPIEGLKVLDLGCGEFASGISEEIPLLPFREYVGVEIHKPTFERARVKQLKAKRVGFVNMEIIEFLETVKNDKFDVIMMFDVLEHFEKKDALRILSMVEKICTKRLIFFMPIGDHTLEANDGIVAGNPYQKHLSEWSKDEWIKLGYDIELWKGFHHSGKLDAAWIYKDTEHMVKCKVCGTECNSSYWLTRHMQEHSTPGKTQGWEIPLANDTPVSMPPVILRFSKKVELSVNQINIQRQLEAVVPYAQVSDITRILTEAYGDGIIVSQEFTT